MKITNTAVLGLTVAGSLLLPSAAHAGAASIFAGQLNYKAHDGEANDVLFAGTVGNPLVVDQGVAAIKVGPGCRVSALSPKIAECDPGNGIVVDLGDRDDKLRLQLPNSTRVFLGSGDDTLISDTGGSFFNTVAANGGPGADIMTGGVGADSFRGDEGDDTLSGGIDRDALIGDAGDDIINGGDGDDSMVGGTGDDVLEGEGGDDDVRGAEDDDDLTGGPGRDIFSGGPGRDVLRAGDDLLPDVRLDGGTGRDTAIVDFFDFAITPRIGVETVGF